MYGDDGTCRSLCFDLDCSRGGAARVLADATRLVRELESAGARVITDVSPNGGRHVYVPLAERLDYTSARELVEAIATAYPTMDPGPHQSLRTGCIRVPGAAHAKGGHQALTMSLNIAVDVLHRPSPAAAVAALQHAYRAQIDALRTAQAPLQASEPATDPHSSAARAAGPSARLTRIARDGVYDTGRYPSPSEARQAVIAGAAAAGWHLADVAARLTDGRWPGLAALYARYSPTQRHGALARDWHKAQRHVTQLTDPPTTAGNHTVHRSNTSAQESQGAPQTSATSTPSSAPGEPASERQSNTGSPGVSGTALDSSYELSEKQRTRPAAATSRSAPALWRSRRGWTIQRSPYCSTSSGRPAGSTGSSKVGASTPTSTPSRSRQTCSTAPRTCGGTAGKCTR